LTYLSQFDLLQSLTVNEVRKNRNKGLHRGVWKTYCD